jgi:CRISPR-associated protein Csx10
MKIIHLTIKTIQPVLATSFEGDPNSDVSYSYLPGSLVRGALIGQYLRQSDQPELDLNDPKVQCLFFRKCFYLNAYPVSQSGQRTLPVPISWVKEKGEEIPLTAYDFSLEVNDDIQSPKPLGRGFWGYDSKGTLNLYQPRKRINIHHARNRPKGRGTATEGEIFRYEAIDAGETFAGIIICPTNYVPEIKTLLTPHDFWLGGSQSAGYGHVQIINSVGDELDLPWREANAQQEVDYEDGIQITLLSDVILRDEMGQVTASPELLIQAIANKFNVDLTIHPDRRSSVGHTLIGGFNRKWGLPLPQLPALAMGSVLVVQGNLTPAQIQQLETEGIGERRIDGFGRLAVNLWQQEKFRILKPNQSTHLPSIPLLDGEDLKTMDLLAQRILHQRLESELQRKASELSIEGKISNSQISRLQLIARASISQGHSTDLPEPLKDLLKNLPKNAKSQFEQAKVNGKSLMNWLITNLDEPGCWINNPDHLSIKFAGQPQQYSINASMKRQYTLRLIMALAKKATKMETPL